MTDSETNATPRRKPRKVSLRRAPMKHVFIGRWLGDGQAKLKRRTNNEVSAYLMEQALRDLGGRPLTGPDPVTDERLSRQFAYETLHAMQHGDLSRGVNWYKEAIARTIEIAGLMYPELVDDGAAEALGHANIRSAQEAKTVLCCALAITSQNNTVHENCAYALEQYAAFRTTGAFFPKTYGAKGASVANNLVRFNELLEVHEGDLSSLRDFLEAPYTMSELRSAAAKFGINITARELADETVYGSIVFGPKIGNAFLSNLLGNLKPLTVDLWFTRSWGRLTGRLVKGTVTDDQKDRLRDTLTSAGFLQEMAESGLHADPKTVHELADEDLVDLCGNLTLLWERFRKSLVAKGYDDNKQLSEFKAKLGWPGAAQSISKSLGASVDAPATASERRWIRQVMERAVEILAGNGVIIEPATMQAVLWYAEKAGWDHLSGRKVGTFNVSFDEAMARLATRAGIDHDAIARVFSGSEHDRPAGPGLREEPRGDDAGTAQGLPEGAEVDRGDALEEARPEVGMMLA
ncbi:conserved hypothetical protein [Hyphomicrobiales bacterium]|jgi:hypothetical protein|nr:conserved hypothetical protein [Hyphomicrobiales bacterium]CAH1702878.1 conserved hypothetical protein [Hyphomicrobiales bacterium]CAI0347065.1 conserved hypothetical protein [Hyphomicrobiales bacterium]